MRQKSSPFRDPGDRNSTEEAARLFERILERYDPVGLKSDFETICGFGGRLSGTKSERNAVRYLKTQLGDLPNGTLSIQPVAYRGWACERATLRVASEECPIPLHPLVGSAPTPPNGLSTQVVDLGVGTKTAFQRAGSRLKGRLVLVRHEYMFSPSHTHRIEKYNMAIKAGAAGLIVANPLDDSGAATGGVMADAGRTMPAVGVSRAAGDLLSAAAKAASAVELHVNASRTESSCENLILDLGGNGAGLGGVILISAHVDGHALSESAIDNASGLAVAVQIGKALAPISDELGQPVRICFFNVEEWGLLGSKAYVEGLTPAAREAIALNINLDSVAGAEGLTGLISGFPELKDLLDKASRQADVPVNTYEPLLKNSDHFWFAQAGIPAMRLVAGFNDPDSNVKYVLTANDGRQLVRQEELEGAFRLSAAILACAIANA